jgi:hypothetical protein
MKESKEITDRWLKRSFFLSCEMEKIKLALKFHDEDKMDLKQVAEIFDALKETAVQRSKAEQTRTQINNILR